MQVGNDFLPPLPTLDIAEGALNSLFEIYKEELPTLGGYITYEGVFDPVRLERILLRLAALEESVLAQRCARAMLSMRVPNADALRAGAQCTRRRGLCREEGAARGARRQAERHRAPQTRGAG